MNSSESLSRFSDVPSDSEGHTAYAGEDFRQHSLESEDEAHAVFEEEQQKLKSLCRRKRCTGQTLSKCIKNLRSLDDYDGQLVQEHPNFSCPGRSNTALFKAGTKHLVGTGVVASLINFATNVHPKKHSTQSNEIYYLEKLVKAYDKLDRLEKEMQTVHPRHWKTEGDERKFKQLYGDAMTQLRRIKIMDASLSLLKNPSIVGEVRKQMKILPSRFEELQNAYNRAQQKRRELLKQNTAIPERRYMPYTPFLA